METASPRTHNPKIVNESLKLLVFRAGSCKMLVRIANREDPDQTASSIDTVNVRTFQTLFFFCSQIKCWFSGQELVKCLSE